MFRNTLVETIRNIQHNNIMSFASVVSIVAATIILGALIIITINVNHVAYIMRESLELKVFLTDDADLDSLAELEDFFEENDLVVSYEYESRDTALERYSEKLQDYSVLLEGFTESNNPVSDSYTVAVVSPDQLEELTKQIEDENNPAVDYVKFGEEYIDTVMLFSTISDYVCLAIFIVLTIISLVIIYNTIKLTCYSRRKEIEIMRFLGASNWYIKLPFFFEGLVLGVFGAFWGVLLLATVYSYLMGFSGSFIALPLEANLVEPIYVMIPIGIFSFVYGIIVGAFGSLFSIRKFFYT